jgi:polyhydroxybutyrate depolymerase
VILSATVILSNACISLDPEGVDRNLDGTLESGGILRAYQVHLPPDYEGKQLPVVFILHGGGGTSLGIRLHTSFDQFADAWGFMAVYPEGWAGSWAEGCECTDADTAGVNDVLFFSELIDELDAQLGIDRSRVYAVGFSAGGIMMHKLACDLADELAAVGSVSGTLSGPLSETCSPASTMPFMMIHGTADEVIGYKGEPDQGNFTLLSADSTAQFWATANNCGERLPSEPYVSGASAGIEVWTESWDCAAGSEVTLYRIVGGAHTWPTGSEFSASWEIAAFFSEH